MTPRTVTQLFDLSGKTALVTGGSRGLGLQMAHALGEAGARIMLSSRKAGDSSRRRISTRRSPSPDEAPWHVWGPSRSGR